MTSGVALLQGRRCGAADGRRGHLQRVTFPFFLTMALLEEGGWRQSDFFFLMTIYLKCLVWHAWENFKILTYSCNPLRKN